MQRYYVHIVDGNKIHRDSEGSEAANLKAAEELAQDAARELVAEALMNKKSNCSAVLLVEDDQERQLFEISVSCNLSTIWLI